MQFCSCVADLVYEKYIIPISHEFAPSPYLSVKIYPRALEAMFKVHYYPPF